VQINEKQSAFVCVDQRNRPEKSQLNEFDMNKTYNILFLCTGNSARSVMAEAFTWAAGKGRFNTFSAGSHPTGRVNPFAIEQVQSVGYPLERLRSKSWDEFAVPDAPKMDFIVTVCDNAAGEVCPIWPGHPTTAHWGFEDPAAVEGSDEVKRKAFEKIARQISQRVSLFTSLPLHILDATAIGDEVRKIGKASVS
jgi:arsenate reductase (thioredoxin)